MVVAGCFKGVTKCFRGLMRFQGRPRELHWFFKVLRGFQRRYRGVPEHLRRFQGVGETF